MDSMNAQSNMPVATLQMDSPNSCHSSASSTSSKRQNCDGIDDEKNDNDDDGGLFKGDEPVTESSAVANNVAAGTPTVNDVDDVKPSVDRIRSLDDERSMSPHTPLSHRLEQENSPTISNVDKSNNNNSTVDSNIKLDSDTVNSVGSDDDGGGGGGGGGGVIVGDSSVPPIDTNETTSSSPHDMQDHEQDERNAFKAHDSVGEVNSDVDRRNVVDNANHDDSDALLQHTNNDASMFEANYEEPKYEKRIDEAAQHLNFEQQQSRCDEFQQHQQQHHHQQQQQQQHEVS